MDLNVRMRLSGGRKLEQHKYRPRAMRLRRRTGGVPCAGWLESTTLDCGVCRRRDWRHCRLPTLNGHSLNWFRHSRKAHVPAVPRLLSNIVGTVTESRKARTSQTTALEA